MKRFSAFLISASLLVSCSGSGDVLTMVTGSFTDSDGTGLRSYEFNQDTGQWKLLSSAKATEPTFVIFSKNGKYLYAVNETDRANSAVQSYSFDPGSGEMTLVSTRPTDRESPCHLSTDGSLLLASNYGGGSMSVFELGKRGQIKPFREQIDGGTGGPDQSRQSTAHLHCSIFTPDGKYVFASDFSADRILRFRLKNKNLIYIGASPVRPDSGPRHITFSPDGRYCYVIGELSGEITVFGYEDGNLNTVQTVRADDLFARGSADIHFSPDGRFLYASNRLEGDGIAIFRANKEDGTLERVGYQSTGVHPRNFTISPNGKYLLCACRDSEVVRIFRIDARTGLLEDTHNDIQVHKPLCVLLGN